MQIIVNWLYGPFQQHGVFVSKRVESALVCISG